MKRTSVTASLGGTSLQFEDDAYARLEAYLAEAAQTLDGNPDRDEIMADLEHAVVDQCRQRLAPGQSVVTLGELQPALEQIGSVQPPDAAEAPRTAREEPREERRRLEQVSEGAMIAGVCLGFARYLQLDVVLLRVIAVLLLFATGGGMAVVYLALMLLLPMAPLSPGHAPLGTLPTKSREFVGWVHSKLGAAPG